MHNFLKKLFLFIIVYTGLFIGLIQLDKLLNQPYASTAFAAKMLAFLSWLTPIYISYGQNNTFTNSGFNVFFPVINLVWTFGIYKLIIWIWFKCKKNQTKQDEK